MRFASAFCVLCLLSLPAAANVADYCAAYARDQADLGKLEKSIWQRRYDNALQTCSEQFTPQEPVALAKKPKQPVAKIAPEKPKQKADTKPAPEAKVIEPKKVATLPQLTEGSDEWLAYCKKKYVSFDEAKGTYQSKTGVERKCLVTAD